MFQSILQSAIVTSFSIVISCIILLFKSQFLNLAGLFALFFFVFFFFPLKANA